MVSRRGLHVSGTARKLGGTIKKVLEVLVNYEATQYVLDAHLALCFLNAADKETGPIWYLGVSQIAVFF